jgi:hypothetical protein
MALMILFLWRVVPEPFSMKHWDPILKQNLHFGLTKGREAMERDADDSLRS